MTRPGAIVRSAALTAFATLVPVDRAVAAPLDLLVGAEVGAGVAHLGRPDDQPGELTLLYGTAFTGPAWHATASAAVGVWRWLEVTGALGVSQARLNGYAQTSTTRRELDLTLTSLAVPIGLRFRPARERNVVPLTGAGVGVRIGLSAQASDSAARAAADDDVAPGVRPATALFGFVEAGVRVRAGDTWIPIVLRASGNPLYPDSTARRLEGFESFEQPGKLRVEYRWDAQLSVGFEIAPR
jgi:hypothetical protein